MIKKEMWTRYFFTEKQVFKRKLTHELWVANTEWSKFYTLGIESLGQ